MIFDEILLLQNIVIYVTFNGNYSADRATPCHKPNKDKKSN